MIVIKKDKKEMEVTDSVYRNYFKNSGWIIKDENSEVSDNETNSSVEATDEFTDEEWDSVENEKSIDEMDGNELREYANILGIDISGLNSNRKIREAIRSAIK